MASIQITIRNEVKTAVTAASAGYVIPVLDLENIFLPKEKLEDLGAKPFVKFVAIGFSSNRQRILRSKAYEVEVPVQVAVQKRVVNAFDDNEMAQLVELVEQITRTCEQDFVSGTMRFSWDRTEPMRDENGLTYTYQDLMVNGVFQSIFTPVFLFKKS